MPELRSDGEDSSLDGAAGGAARVDGAAPIDGGRTLCGIGDAGIGRCTGGAEPAGGADCACADSDADTARALPRMIVKSFTARSPVLNVPVRS